MGTGKRASSKKNLVPGPGQYNLNTTIGHGPKFSISMKLDGHSDRTFSPGPANYNPNFITLHRNPSYSFRQRPQTAKIDNTPGVGNYNLRDENSLKTRTYK
jgi:hypothetical protein